MPIFASKFNKRNYSVGAQTYQEQKAKEMADHHAAIKIYERQLGKHIDKNHQKNNYLMSDPKLARNIKNSFITGGADLTERSPKSKNINYNAVFQQMK